MRRAGDLSITLGPTGLDGDEAGDELGDRDGAGRAAIAAGFSTYRLVSGSFQAPERSDRRKS